MATADYDPDCNNHGSTCFHFAAKRWIACEKCKHAKTQSKKTVESNDQYLCGECWMTVIGNATACSCVRNLAAMEECQISKQSQRQRQPEPASAGQPWAAAQQWSQHQQWQGHGAQHHQQGAASGAASHGVAWAPPVVAGSTPTAPTHPLEAVIEAKLTKVHSDLKEGIQFSIRQAKQGIEANGELLSSALQWQEQILLGQMKEHNVSLKADQTAFVAFKDEHRADLAAVKQEHQETMAALKDQILLGQIKEQQRMDHSDEMLMKLLAIMEQQKTSLHDICRDQRKQRMAALEEGARRSSSSSSEIRGRSGKSDDLEGSLAKSDAWTLENPSDAQGNQMILRLNGPSPDEARGVTTDCDPLVAPIEPAPEEPLGAAVAVASATEECD